VAVEVAKDNILGCLELSSRPLSNYFDFQLGAADYIAVAENYHTVFISDIPVMSMRIRDKVLVKID
jgi:predicted ATPase